MYSKEFFIDRFKEDETNDLVGRYATAELTDSAKEAILEILSQRGVSKDALQPALKDARKAAHRQTRGTSRCDYCGSPAKYIYVKDGGQRFCNETCLRDARLMEISEDIPDAEIVSHAREIKISSCPVCKKQNGTVDARWHYRVWSALIFSRWTKNRRVCCRSCGIKLNVNSIGFCLLFGWWGFPWGVFITPIQILSNIFEMFRGGEASGVSDDLLLAARLNLASALQKKNATFASRI